MMYQFINGKIEEQNAWFLLATGMITKVPHMFYEPIR
nr:unnamed protein product [Callosobruchus chinensis]